MTRGKLLLAALIAALLLSMGAGSASASRSLSIDRATIPAASAALTLEDGFVRVVCPVTLTLTANPSRTATKSGRFGTTSATVNTAACTGGKARTIGGNWETTQVAFTGTLPSITSLTLELRGVTFLVEQFGGLGECSFRGNAQGITIQSGQRISGINARQDRGIPLERNLGGLFCPEIAFFRGTFTIPAGSLPTIFLL
jgi:hypothetical protein